MRTRMYGGVTGKASDGLPMSIATSFAGSAHNMLRVTCFAGSAHNMLRVTCFAGSAHNMLRVTCFAGSAHNMLRVACFAGGLFVLSRRWQYYERLLWVPRKLPI